MSNSSRVMAKHLPDYLSQPSGLGWKAPTAFGSQPVPEIAVTPTPPAAPPELDVHQMEKQMILRALERSGNNRTEAAELLNMSRRTLQRKLRQMGMVRKNRQRPTAAGAAE